jgi:hypothetical protein
MKILPSLILYLNVEAGSLPKALLLMYQGARCQCNHNSLQLDSILNKYNSVHILTPLSFNTQFNSIFPSIFHLPIGLFLRDIQIKY